MSGSRIRSRLVSGGLSAMRLHRPTAPYPGLRAYEESEATIFVGRQGQIGQVLNRLETHRFAAVVGGSGSGKSSLVRAGVVPALLTDAIPALGDLWLVAYMRPLNDPLGGLTRAIDHLFE